MSAVYSFEPSSQAMLTEHPSASIANFIRLAALVKLKSSNDDLCKSPFHVVPSIADPTITSRRGSRFSLVRLGSEHRNHRCGHHRAPAFDATLQRARLRRFVRRTRRRHEADTTTDLGQIVYRISNGARTGTPDTGFVVILNDKWLGFTLH